MGMNSKAAVKADTNELLLALGWNPAGARSDFDGLGWNEEVAVYEQQGIR